MWQWRRGLFDWEEDVVIASLKEVVGDVCLSSDKGDVWN